MFDSIMQVGHCCLELEERPEDSICWFVKSLIVTYLGDEYKDEEEGSDEVVQDMESQKEPNNEEQGLSDEVVQDTDIREEQETQEQGASVALIQQSEHLPDEDYNIGEEDERTIVRVTIVEKHKDTRSSRKKKRPSLFSESNHSNGEKKPKFDSSKHNDDGDNVDETGGTGKTPTPDEKVMVVTVYTGNEKLIVNWDEHYQHQVVDDEVEVVQVTNLPREERDQIFMDQDDSIRKERKLVLEGFLTLTTMQVVNLTCSLCQNFFDEDVLTKNMCPGTHYPPHVFCMECSVKHAHTGNRCPMCRKSIFEYDYLYK